MNAWPRGARLIVLAATMALLVPAGAALAAPAGASDDVRVKVIVRYERPARAADVARLRALGATIRYRYRNVRAIAATMPSAALPEVRATRGVVRVERDHRLWAIDHSAATGDPELERAWGVEHIGAGRAHAAGEMGSGVRVAVIDTGIACSHPDLDERCDPGISYIDSAPFVDGVAFDDHGHGTHVAGSLGAERSPDSYGVVGVAPRVRLVALKVLSGSGQGDYSGLIAALDQVATWNSDGQPGNDVAVVNMSLGGSEASAALAEAVDAAWASGAVLVAASGNVDPTDIWQLLYGCPVMYPARYGRVLATTFTNGNDALTGYSCTGPEVDFASPGDGIYSTVPTSGGVMANTSGFATASGTSMASPHLAGTIALLLAYGLSDTNGNGNLQDEVKAHLCATAGQGFGVLSTAIPPSDPRYPQYFGCGVIDAGRALVDEPPGEPPPNAPPTVDARGPYSGDEGTAVALDAATSDPDGDTLTKLWTWQAQSGVDEGAGCTFADETRTDTSVTCTDDGTYTLTLRADDGQDATTDSTSLTLANVAPGVSIDSPVAGAIFETGQTVSLERTVTDPGANDTRTCRIDWGDGAETACSQGHAYGSAGDFTIRVTVTDDDGDPGSDSVIISVVEPPPPPPPPPPPTVELRFTPVADAFVNASRPTRNYGTGSRLRVKSGRYRSYLRFEVEGVSGTIMSARLRLFVADASNSGGSVRPVEDVLWGEYDITWSDSPAMGETIIAQVGAVAKGTWIEVDVSSLVTGSGAWSLALTDGSGDPVQYHSREAARKPQLVLIIQE